MRGVNAPRNHQLRNVALSGQTPAKQAGSNLERRGAKTAIEAIIKAIILIVICSPYLLRTQSYCFPTAFQSNAVNNVPTRLRVTSTSLTHYKKMAGI